MSLEHMQPGANLGGGANIKEARATIITPEFRVSFPWVMRKQKPRKADQEGKYSLTMLFPVGANLQNLFEEVSRAIIEAHGNDKSRWPTLKNPFHDQGDKAHKFEGYEAGGIYITATAKAQPGLVDAQVMKIIDESKFYAGCYAIAEIRAFCYDSDGVKGVSFGLNNVQKTRDGVPFSGRQAPEDVFSPITPAAGAAGGSKPLTAAELFG